MSTRLPTRTGMPAGLSRGNGMVSPKGVDGGVISCPIWYGRRSSSLSSYSGFWFLRNGGDAGGISSYFGVCVEMGFPVAFFVCVPVDATGLLAIVPQSSTGMPTAIGTVLLTGCFITSDKVFLIGSAAGVKIGCWYELGMKMG